ncbi:CaiB/BaiF CoA transferase family protein [Gymnodinialimonas ulvae]|uniref:CaiB/BaiF CoA transferase family protein n=1 Tax=Gymnodinialimonas ulvae TaxID=3126504 RepID=UPI0030B59BA4
MTDAPLPLAGVKVVDLTRILSGPFCSMILGDLGADVIKVESPGGDAVRGQGRIVGGLSWYFAGFNRNKRSITLDLRSDGGKSVLHRLLQDADIVTENFRPGVMAKMGLGPDRLKQINPDLIVVSVNGYGSTGPYADRPAFDFIAQAMSGFMSTNGTRETGPFRAGNPISDLVAGLYAALGAVAALRGREAGGPAQSVEASMMMSTLSMMAYLSSDALASGENPVPTGNDHPIASPYGLFHASDGDIAVSPSTEAICAKFMAELGLSDLLNDPRFDTNAKRLANRPALNARINDVTVGDTQASWITRLNQAGVPCGRVQSMIEVLNDPQVAAQEMVLDVPHPGHGSAKMTGFPVKFSETPLEVRHAAPKLGEHFEIILREAGYSDQEIEQLRAEQMNSGGSR